MGALRGEEPAAPADGIKASAVAASATGAVSGLMSTSAPPPSPEDPAAGRSC